MFVARLGLTLCCCEMLPPVLPYLDVLSAFSARLCSGLLCYVQSSTWFQELRYCGVSVFYAYKACLHPNMTKHHVHSSHSRSFVESGVVVLFLWVYICDITVSQKRSHLYSHLISSTSLLHVLGVFTRVIFFFLAVEETVVGLLSWGCYSTVRFRVKWWFSFSFFVFSWNSILASLFSHIIRDETNSLYVFLWTTGPKHLSSSVVLFRVVDSELIILFTCIRLAFQFQTLHLKQFCQYSRNSLSIDLGHRRSLFVLYIDEFCHIGRACKTPAIFSYAKSNVRRIIIMTRPSSSDCSVTLYPLPVLTLEICRHFKHCTWTLNVVLLCTGATNLHNPQLLLQNIHLIYVPWLRRITLYTCSVVHTKGSGLSIVVSFFLLCSYI